MTETQAQGRVGAPIQVHDLTALRQFAGNVLPQTERNGLDLCFLAVSIGGAASAGLAGDLAERRILGCIRAGDYLARSDQARFIIMLAPGCPVLAATVIAERIRAAVEARSAGAKDGLSCTIGITSTRDDLLDIERILANSSSALDRCEEGTARAIRHFSQETDSEIARHMRVSRELEHALDDGCIVPWFQPQISLATGELTGFEALARWQHPERGTLAPGEFLDIAEESGQIERIGEAILTGSLRAMKTWKQQGLSVPRVAVNLSPTQLSNPCLADMIKWELDRLDIDPSEFTVEILETVLGTSDSGVIARNLRGLKSAGVRVDLDDFGTGHASIINIRRFGVHRIKIDRSFVRDIDRDPEQQKMTRAMVIMADALGVEVLAEGVETDAEENFLQSIGCHYIQGYALARPMPAARAAAWMRGRMADRKSA